MKGLILIAALGAALSSALAQTAKSAAAIQRIAKSGGGTTVAVRVADAPLIFTGQIFSADLANDARAQANRALDALAALLEKSGSDTTRVLRLHAYVTDDRSVAAVEAAVAARFASALPAFTLVRTSLARAGALVAFEAVAASTEDASTVHVLDGSAALLPAGGKIFLSGQAEKGADVATAVKLTMAGLHRSLTHLGLVKADVVQVKAYLRPMTDHAAALREISSTFDGTPVPPVVLVEWKSDLFAEIELVASAHALPAPAGNQVGYSALPWLTPSPRYSHVCHVAAGVPLIFLAAIAGDDGTEPRAQLKTIFERLGSVLFEAGSSFRQLAKATYYLGDPEVRAMLGDIRGVYFDPTRAPAASAIGVSGFGHPGRAAAVEMIAVPTK